MSACAGGSWRLSGGAALVIAFLVIAVFGRQAHAETLEQALSDAYLINPVLNAERARLRATDEQVALAKSGLRPFISGSADTNFVNQNSDVKQARKQNNFLDLGPLGQIPIDTGGSSGGATSDGVTHPRGYSVQLTQPLFEGFQNLNAVRQAKSTVQAAISSFAFAMSAFATGSP